MNIKRTFVLGFIIICWLLFIGSVFISSIPNNPIKLSAKLKVVISNFFPEGWAFFTKSPKEEHICVYSILQNNLYQLDAKSSSPNNWLGITRIGRLKGLELNYLVSQIDSTKWKECDKEIKNCLNSSPIDTLQVNNSSSIKQMCGLFVIIKQKTITWAWRASKKKLVLPSKYVIIYAKCNS